MRYESYEEHNIPLVVYLRGEPWAFCDVSERDSSLKATPKPEISKSRYQRLLRASQRRNNTIRAEQSPVDIFSDQRPRRPVYPQIWMLVLATDGLWGCFLPTPEEGWEDQEHLTVDPKWFRHLGRGKKYVRPKPRPTRLAKKILARERHEQVQGAFEPGFGKRVEGSGRDSDSGSEQRSGWIQDAIGE